MKIPDSLKRFVGEAQWKKLCMDELDDEDRKMLVGLLEAGFEGIDPDEISPGNVEETLELVQGLSDDLRGAWDDGEMTEEELSAGEQTSDEVIEELKREATAKKGTKSAPSGAGAPSRPHALPCRLREGEPPGEPTRRCGSGGPSPSRLRPLK